MKSLNLLWVESKRQWIMFKRYPVEAFAGVVIFTILFVGLFEGAQYVNGGMIVNHARLDLVVAGYVVWLVTTGLFAGPGSHLLDDARTGILEQLFVTPHNFAIFTFIRAVSGLIQHLLLIAVVLLIICLVSGTRLDYQFAELAPFFAVMMGACGLGLMVAGYAVLAKQVSAVLGIGQFLLLPLVIAPIPDLTRGGIWISAVMPLNYPALLLQKELANAYVANWGELVVAIANGSLYLLAGLLVLHTTSNRARALANIGLF